MERMQRTQIYLEPDLNSALDRLARQRGVSKANLLRLAARRLLDEEQDRATEDPILGLIGLGNGGSGHAAEDHDLILSGHAMSAR